MPSTSLPRCASSSERPSPSAIPSEKFRDCRLEQVRIRSPSPERPVSVSGLAPKALPKRTSSAKPRVVSAAAALTTRGFAELVRFGRAFGAKPETLTGLSGLGDLILTCSSRQSRNFSLGIALGEGCTLEEAQRGKLVEGIFTASVLAEMAQAKGVEMPIAAAVAAVLDGRLRIDAAIESLLTRPFRAEG